MLEWRWSSLAALDVEIRAVEAVEEADESEIDKAEV